MIFPRRPAPGNAEPLFAAGTLRYTRQGLYFLFFCLLWNDLCLMLMEQVAPQLTPLLLKDHGATSRQIALFSTTLTGMMTVWINPVFSTWSDRYRSPRGRRRPFLLAVTPFCALFLALIPFMPNLAAFLRFAGPVPLIGVCYMVYAIFNAVLLALFSYYFWDVVPVPVLGRFSALTKVISTVAVFIWNFFLFGLTTTHLKAVFVGTAAFFLIVYLLSVWRVKEGDYPPPPPAPGGGLIHWLRSYFVECFSSAEYRWIFAASAVYQIGNVSNVFQIFYLRDQLGLDLDTIGKMRSFPSLGILFLGYSVGTLIDRWNPIRLVVPAMALFALSNVICFLFLRDRWSLLACTSLIVFSTFVLGVAQSILYVEFFPREKIGQLCSAKALVQQVACLAIATPVGALMDWIHDYRYAYLWSAGSEVLAVFLFARVYLLWCKRRREPAQALAAEPVA